MLAADGGCGVRPSVKYRQQGTFEERLEVRMSETVSLINSQFCAQPGGTKALLLWNLPAILSWGSHTYTCGLPSDNNGLTIGRLAEQ